MIKFKNLIVVFILSVITLCQTNVFACRKCDNIREDIITFVFGEHKGKSQAIHNLKCFFGADDRKKHSKLPSKI